MENLMNTLDVETQLRHAKKAIEELQDENKSLKENLQAIAGSTQDSEEPLTKLAVKHLKK